MPEKHLRTAFPPQDMSPDKIFSAKKRKEVSINENYDKPHTACIKIYQGPAFQRNIPYIAHKKLAMVTPSAHGWRVNKSVLLGEIDRIYHKVRPSLAYQPVEDYLNSRSIVSFDDETRSIRAQTADLLKRIYTPIPRAQRPLPLAGDSYYSHSELPITDRITSDHYIDRLIHAPRNVHSDVLAMSYYDEPAKRYSRIGKGNLACVSFAGGRPISRRRNLATTHDNIRNDINVLSHYGRFRAAAAAANVSDTEYIPPSYQAPTKSAMTGSWKSNAPRRTASDRSDLPKDAYRPRELTAGAEYDAALERKRKRREALEAAAMKELQEEKRHKQRGDDIAKLASLEKEEEERKERENAERLEAERKAKEDAERKAKEEEEAKLRKKEEEERKAKEEAARKAEEERLEREEKERVAKEEAERKAKEEEEKKAREEEERKAREEAERLAKEEEERKAKEEAERLAKEEEERKAKEEEERLAKEEEERLAKEEEERLAKEEEERLAKEEEERLAKEEEERKAAEEAENQAAEEEEASPKETEGPAAEEEEPAEEVEEEQAAAEPEAVPETEETTEEPKIEEPASPEPVATTEPAPEADEEPEETEEQAEDE